jgi:hypothetical protein
MVSVQSGKTFPTNQKIYFSLSMKNEFNEVKKNESEVLPFFKVSKYNIATV